MDTPIFDLVRAYAAQGTARLHMPGHKGRGALGCEALDITEIAGADELYAPRGIIAASERNATALFHTQRTVYSTEGATQCIKAMLYLALLHRGGRAMRVLAARNVHRAFLSAAALLDLEVDWLWGEADDPLCACSLTPEALEAALARYEAPPCAVYLTSPDYLGRRADLAALARVCHAHGTLLLLDGAHGAYLPFLGDTGAAAADLCCASAHKTLPVLTGGAYLHLGLGAPAALAADMKSAMALFGSTSPSYLTLASLDACNAFLAGEGPAQLRAAAAALDARKALIQRAQGWVFAGAEPLKLTLNTAAHGRRGEEVAAALRCAGLEPEYAEPDALVLMVSAATTAAELDALTAALCAIPRCVAQVRAPYAPALRPERVCSIRAAVFAPAEELPLAAACGRICAAPVAACPPAVPLVMSGERLDAAALAALAHYGAETVRVVRE